MLLGAVGRAALLLCLAAALGAPLHRPMRRAPAADGMTETSPVSFQTSADGGWRLRTPCDGAIRGMLHCTGAARSLLPGSTCLPLIGKRTGPPAHCMFSCCLATAPCADSVERRVTTVGRVHPHLEAKVIDPGNGKIVPHGTVRRACPCCALRLPRRVQGPACLARRLRQLGCRAAGEHRPAAGQSLAPSLSRACLALRASSALRWASCVCAAIP